MSEIEVLTEFKKNLISFFDELIDQFPEEPDLVIMRIFLTDQIPIKDVMDIFSHKLNKDSQKFKKMIKERNEAFFIENNLFDLNPSQKNKINHFKTLWRSGRLDEQDKLVVWKWVDSFVFLVDKYAKVFQPIFI